MASEPRDTEHMQEITVTDGEPTLAELISRLTDQLSTLMRDEMALAKAELKQEARKAGKAGGMLSGAALAGYMALLLLSFAAAWGLAALMPTGFAFLIVGVVYGVVAAVLGVTGRKKAQAIDPTPRATVETLKEDAQWAKEEARRRP